jgi:beta-glucanase (GH16 family)
MRIWMTTAMLMLASSTAMANDVPKDYKLVWADEFDKGTAPDPAKWSYDTNRNKAGWYNDEAQYYSDNRRENARLEDGKLIIEARKEDLSALPDWGKQAYSSARLITRGKAQWTHGYFDVRAKLPCGTGQWPAIWLLGTGQWPDSGEIDIMEAVGFEPNVIYGNVHTSHSVSDKVKQGGETRVADYCDTFHNYQALWTDKSITFYVDGKAFYTFDKPADDVKKWPFDGPEYLILNVAIGGVWGGQKGIDDTKFPNRMVVDYVRVYQKLGS